MHTQNKNGARNTKIKKQCVIIKKNTRQNYRTLMQIDFVRFVSVMGNDDKRNQC